MLGSRSRGAGSRDFLQGVGARPGKRNLEAGAGAAKNPLKTASRARKLGAGPF